MAHKSDLLIRLLQCLGIANHSRLASIVGADIDVAGNNVGSCGDSKEIRGGGEIQS